MMPSVFLENDTNHANVPALEDFQSWVDAVFAEMDGDTKQPHEDVFIILATQTESAHLNETYRKKTGPTNVLSFTYDPVPGIEKQSLGDLVLCVEIIESEAEIQAKPLFSHYAHLTIHGVLHLLGYDHVTIEDAQTMETLEIKIMNKLGFTNPYE